VLETKQGRKYVLEGGVFRQVGSRDEWLLEEPDRPLSLLGAVGLQVTETKQYLPLEEGGGEGSLAPRLIAPSGRRGRRPEAVAARPTAGGPSQVT
jgi:hypothetical protein